MKKASLVAKQENFLYISNTYTKKREYLVSPLGLLLRSSLVYGRGFFLSLFGSRYFIFIATSLFLLECLWRLRRVGAENYPFCTSDLMKGFKGSVRFFNILGLGLALATACW
jgi:hypothetical protein